MSPCNQVQAAQGNASCDLLSSQMKVDFFDAHTEAIENWRWSSVATGRDWSNFALTCVQNKRR